MSDMHLNEIEMESDHIFKEELAKRPSIEASKKFILDKANSFDGIPFTIQRYIFVITNIIRFYFVLNLLRFSMLYEEKMIKMI